MSHSNWARQSPFTLHSNFEKWDGPNYNQDIETLPFSLYSMSHAAFRHLSATHNKKGFVLRLHSCQTILSKQLIAFPRYN